MYGVFKLKKLFGKSVIGLERSTFIINKQGELIQEYRGVKPKGHAEEVLAFVKDHLS